MYVGIVAFILEAAGSEIYQLHLGLIRLRQQHILWFKIAVHYFVLEQVLEGDKDLKGETLGEGDGEPLEIVVLNELVQVDAQHLK